MGPFCTGFAGLALGALGAFGAGGALGALRTGVAVLAGESLLAFAGGEQGDG
ncbi:hypothetical protein L6V77_31210 [Myxococcota bacterium]|nr:hypothetical protein [Myxococcota bacterium]